MYILMILNQKITLHQICISATQNRYFNPFTYKSNQDMHTIEKTYFEKFKYVRLVGITKAKM